MNFASTKLIKPTWYYSYYSKLKIKKKKRKKKDKVAQQNGIVDVQRKNTVRAFALLYIRKKSTNRLLKKKKYILNKLKVL